MLKKDIFPFSEQFSGLAINTKPLTYSQINFHSSQPTLNAIAYN